MNLLLTISGFLALAIPSCINRNQIYYRQDAEAPPTPQPTIKEHRSALARTIAFGSSGSQDLSQPILALASRHEPDLFVFLGDNITGNTYEMDTLRARYTRLAAKPEYQELMKSTQAIATWGGHDYGWKGAGRSYPFKRESKDIFLDFWKAPSQDARRQREGIYTSYYFEGNWKVLQLILLDTRTFRNGLRPYEGQSVNKKCFPYPLKYWPHDAKDSTFLGAAQWEWLEEQLSAPADLRIIASSTPFGTTYNGYEGWANFPHERERMIQLIKKTKARGVVFISGGARYAELSALRRKDCYTLFDFTSSGITATRDFSTPNFNRVYGPVMENNFGLIEIDWRKEWIGLTFKAIDIEGSVRFQETVLLDELQF